MLGGITKYLRRHHVALLALFIALGGTSAYAAASFINGKQIKPGSLPKNRLTKSAIKSLKGNKGAQGLPGQRGPTGPLGPSNPNASTLQGFPATSLARATTVSAGGGPDPCHGAIFTAFNTVTFTNAVSRSITAPTAGVLLVLGHVSFEFANAGGGSTVSLLGRLTVDGSQKGQMAEGNSSNAVSSCNGGRTMSLDTAVAVAAGNHTIAYQIEKSGGDGKAYVGNGSVTTLFVPFGNAGGQGILGHTQVAGHSGGSNH